MVDIGAKVAFSRSSMIFNVDVEANISDYLAALFRSRQPKNKDLEGGDNEVKIQSEGSTPKFLEYMSGSFTFASVIEDYVSGSRVNIRHSHTDWSKFFLFTGSSFAPFYPNFNPSFSRLGALEYTSERELRSDCLSFTARRRLGPIFSIVGSVSYIAVQTLRSSYHRCWSVALVAEDRLGLDLLVGFNDQGNCCVGIKKPIGDSGVSLRVSTVMKGDDCQNTDWRNSFEIGLEM